MNLVTIEQARAQCKADAADDAVLTVCVNAAEAACAKLANRNLYPDQGALDAALATISASMIAGTAAYRAAIDAAAALAETADQEYARDLAAANLRKVTVTNSKIISGMVVSEDMVAAILLTAAHFYRNREAVITGPGVQAQEVPMSAQAICELNRAHAL